MLSAVLWIAMTMIGLAMVGNFYRVLKGPTIPDRIIALDSIGINLIGLVILLSMTLSTTKYFTFILLIAILSFLGTVAFSKFLEKGVVMEYDRAGD